MRNRNMLLRAEKSRAETITAPFFHIKQHIFVMDNRFT